MKSQSMLKMLAACAVSSITFLGSPAQADSCLLGGMSKQAALFQGGAPGPWMNPMETRFGQEMARIESALRAGQITPYEAGRLARAQWETAQFLRGFQGNGMDMGRQFGQQLGQQLDPQMARQSGTGASCGLSPDLVATLAPIVGNMAKGGIQTASTIMSAVAQEVTRLIREEEQAKELRRLESM